MRMLLIALMLVLSIMVFADVSVPCDECRDLCEGRGETCIHECMSNCIEYGGGGSGCGPLGSSCTEDSQCCSGKCSQNVCVPQCKSSGQSCASDNECCSGLKCYNGFCSSCIPENVYGCNQFPGVDGCCAGLFCNQSGVCVVCYTKNTQCTQSVQCCSKNCQSGKCCLNESSSESCTSNDDCCQNYICNPNTNRCERRHPTKPQKPQIAPIEVLPDGIVDCVSGCTATDYRWKINDMPYAWSGILESFNCTAENCMPGQQIYLQTRNCIGTECNESDWSEPAEVKPYPPPQLLPAGSYLQYIIYALLVALAVLAIAYMFSKAFGIQHWGEIIKDELFQVLASGIVALLLVGITYMINDYLTASLSAISGDTSIPLTGTNQIYTVAYNSLSSLGVQNILLQIQDANSRVAKEASKGIYCSMLGVGFTLVNCSPLNAFRGTLTSASFAVLAGMIDVYAQQFLLTFGANFGFNLLIPLGLFFRCFKPTRQGGGALIAIGFGFYTVYPLVILAGIKLLAEQDGVLPIPQSTSIPSGLTCDPYEKDISVSREQFQNYAMALSHSSVADYLTYVVLVKVIFTSIISLIITLGFIASLAKVLGSEIDLSGLVRIG